MTVLDLSNYDSDVIGNAMCLKVSGVTGAIIGCQRPGIASQQIDALRAVGINTLGVYAFLYFGLDSAGQTAAAIKVAQEKNIKRVWLDVESTGENERAGITPDERASELANCVAMVRGAGLEPGIYTYPSYWPNQMANTTQFADLPLWFASYGADDPEDPEPPLATVNIGGWSAVAIHQYNSRIPVCGRPRDHNYVFEEEDDMTPAEVNQLIEDFVGKALPAYLRGAFEENPLTPDGTAIGAFSDRPDLGMTFPYKPWLPDIEARIRAIPGIASDGGQP